MLSARKPLVTVIMPAYNAASYIGHAIESILTQTYPYFEFIIIDDGSTDETNKIAQLYAKSDQRIRVYRNAHNYGPALATNIGWQLAQGDYIARMDADDVSEPTRLAQQVACLEEYPDVVATGGFCLMIDQDDRVLYTKLFPVNHINVYKSSFTFNALQEGACMINRKLLPKNFLLYEQNMKSAEGVDLIFRLFPYGKVVNLPEYLLRYRLHDKNTSNQAKHMFMLTLQARWRAITKYGYKPTSQDIGTNILQILLFLCLPTSVLLALYKHIRFRSYNRRLYTYGPAWQSNII